MRANTTYTGNHHAFLVLRQGVVNEDGNYENYGFSLEANDRRSERIE